MVVFLATTKLGERDDEDDFFVDPPKATYKLNFLPDNGKEPRDVLSLGNWWIIWHKDFDQAERRKINHLYLPNDRLSVKDDQRYKEATDPKRLNPFLLYKLTDLNDDGLLMLSEKPLNLEILAPTLKYYHATGRHLVVTTARQTGDVPHVAAALALDPPSSTCLSSVAREIKQTRVWLLLLNARISTLFASINKPVNRRLELSERRNPASRILW
jgi:hypothetical protein